MRPARCMIEPSIRSLWMPRAPIARYPGTAVLVRIPAIEPASRPVALARSTPLVWPTAREPDARPPVRGPPGMA
jgi:hypothetical protein